MSYTILGLLLLSAIGHATWNAISRRIEERDAFFTLIMGISLILYAPLAVYLWFTEPFPYQAWGWIVMSIVFEIVYFVTLAKAYRMAPLTTAYPVVRGTTPVATTILSFLLSQSLVGLTGLFGIVMIAIGILFINQTRFSISDLRYSFMNESADTRWAILAGVFTAFYNVSDGKGAILMSGFLFKYVVFIGMFLGKWAIDKKMYPQFSFIRIAKRHPIATLISGFLLFGSNSLAVYAMQSTAVAYVASVREMSIVFAALIGVLWLKEKISTVKWISIATIVAGVLLIKFS